MDQSRPYAPAVPGPPPPAPRLGLLGGFDVRRDGLPLHLPGSCRRLVALLALVPEASHRTQVTARLWPDADDEHARGNLRSVLWRLRRGGGDALLVPGEDLVLDPRVEVDLAAAWEAVRRLMGGRRLDTDLEHHRLLRLDVLPDWDDEWVRQERERYRQARLTALEELSRGLTGCARYGEAISIALTAVDADPLRESAQSALIAAYLAQGNDHEALRQYRTCHRTFVDALGMPPSHRLDDLIEPVLAPR